jgi:putative nucleotidyltransferase with HDIG domain
MAVPTRAEALSLLMSTDPSPRLMQHLTVVAEVASFLAVRAGRAGLAIDRRLVETAALLHDIDKALPTDHPVRALGHGRAGAEWLSQAGHPELARSVAAHPVMALEGPDADSWILQAPLEERIVCYADKRATQRVVSLEQRFERWRRRHPEHLEPLGRAFVRSRHLEAVLCETLGVSADGIERLRWVGQATERATANGRLVDPGAREPALARASAGSRPAARR